MSEQSLLLFVVALALQNLKAQTIKSYLAAVRYSQIMLHFPDPFLKGFPLLDYTVKGIKRVQAERGVKPRPRLPITPLILKTLKAAWVPGTQVSSSMPGKDPPPSSGRDERGDGIMLWAAACTGFFGFLRAAEFTTPSLASFDKGAHLAVGDVALDSHEKPSVVRLNIKASKTDPFRKGVQIFLGKTGTEICPVSALVEYLVMRGPGAGPLFRFLDGSPLSRSALVERVRAALTAAGIDPTPFSGHSFRIGAATSAAANGVEDSMIQTLGRWKSDAYLRYVRIPREQLAAVSKKLI